MRLFLCAVFFCLAASSASAYIDPATGGMIVGGAGGIIWAMLAAFLAGLVAFFARFYRSILSWARGLWKGKR
ncbi:MAG: hypothetical protein V1875_07030 [Candidatus Altiarchaeota archaeon]